MELRDDAMYKVVVNHEEQYSIWPADRASPPGWRDCGKQGSQTACLAWIREVWTDMRPLGVRNRMAGASSPQVGGEGNLGAG